MKTERSYIDKPYYHPSKTLGGQLKSGSKRRKENGFIFLLKKIRNEILERIAYNCPVNGWRIRIHRMRGVHIGKNSFIGRRVTLDHSYPEYIYIGDNISLAGNNFILTHSNPYPHFNKVFKSYVAPVVIEDGAWVSLGAMILPGVTIGRDSVIAAGAVVSKDIPASVIAGGVPAKVLKEINIEG